MPKSLNLFRNICCGSLALAVIASGRVRRAKKRIHDSDVVTAVYFHNPNKRLFARCVRWLSKNGYTFISQDELIRILQGDVKPPKGAVWLSFDDGFKELLDAVVPLVCQAHVPITLFVPAGIVKGDGLFPWLHRMEEVNDMGTETVAHNKQRDSITVADVQKIASYPEVSIGSHTVGHTVTINLSDEQARYEFGESKRALEVWTGAPVNAFAYPEGRIDGREKRRLAECGYQLAATTETRLITQNTDPYLVPRFHVGDNFSFPEAICNMVGVWRPVIDPLIAIWQHCQSLAEYLRHPLRRHCGIRNENPI